jgi:hypothetical protein
LAFQNLALFWVDSIMRGLSTAHIGPPEPSNHAMERTADRSVLHFEMTSTLQTRATRGLGARRSSCSR